MKIDYQDQKVLVLGLGLSGRSMVSFLEKRGAQVFGFDDCKTLKDLRCPYISSIKEVDFKNIDLITFSPGIKPTHPVLLKAQEERILCMGEIELGARELKNPAIGVTGTNGKSTVTALIAHLLNSGKKPAIAIGNIGIPLTSIVDTIGDQIAVIELSSYQIEVLKSKCLDVAILLNITPDHLDRYGSLQNYGASKLLIQNALKESRSFYIEASTLEVWKSSVTTKNTFIYNTFLDELLKKGNRDDFVYFKNKGALEKLNYSAALAACVPFNLDSALILQGLRSFKALPHRCEFVRSLNQVHFYNDSKGTNVESVIKAVTSFNSSLRMIMGGQDKGLDFSLLLPYFKNKVRKIYLIGEVREKMFRAFGSSFDVHLCLTLEEAIHCAYSQSEPEDTILLSPACSSFDMFRNFEHRGNEFKRIVNQLEGERL